MTTATAKPSTQRRPVASPRANRKSLAIAKPISTKPVARAKASPSPKASGTPAPQCRYSFHGCTELVHFPSLVTDLASFRRWAKSDVAPEQTPVFYLSGEVWIDMSKEQIFTHVRLKQELCRILGNLVRLEGRGDLFPDGLLLSNMDAKISVNPDGTYVTRERLRDGRVRLVEGASSGCVELEGSPDMVLEVVSDSSVVKDNQTLRDLYWKAGIPEYWIVDGRGEEVSFTILKQTARGYSAVRNGGGWLKSAVFGKSFRLTRRLDELGHPDFVLDVK